MEVRASRLSIRRPLLMLFPLYFAQGMPFGFQATALPVYLRERGVSLTAIGLIGLLSLPWALKALWAPFVDRYGTGYKAWILPLQLALAVVTASAAFLVETTPLLVSVFLMNLFAATQDIAVDGLAVRTLRPEELGPANAIQVVGYKVGMLTGGGLLVWASGNLGWNVVFFGMAALMLVVFLLTLTVQEGANTVAKESMTGISKNVWAAVKIGGVGLLLITATGKIGEQMIDTMWKLFLVDVGFSKADIGLWQGTYGMLASIAGSLIGGVVCRVLVLERALLLTALLRVPGFLFVTWLAGYTPTPTGVIAATISEHVLSGMMTTALFAYMMSRVDPRIGATHYTLLASIEVFGKSPGALASGAIVEAVGYQLTFAIGTALSLAYCAIVYGFAGGTRLMRSTT